MANRSGDHIANGMLAPVRYLILAIWFGLLTGLGEVCVLEMRTWLLDEFISFGPHRFWMAPLLNVLVFGTVGCFFWTLVMIRPQFPALRVASFLFVFLASASILSMYIRLHGIAVILLAAGLAVQGSRLICVSPARFASLARITLVPLAAIALGGALYAHLATTRGTLVSLPPTGSQSANLLLIVLDTVRASNLSLYGYPRATTPGLERLATTAATFSRAIATAPWTLPSHGSIFTGRLPYELSTDWSTPLDSTYPTLAEILGRHGYLTAGFSANTLYVTSETGLSRGFHHWEDFVISPGEVLRSSSLVRRTLDNYSLRRAIGYYELLGRKTAHDLNVSILRWLTANQGRPFFVFVNYYDAHSPYLERGLRHDRFASRPRRSNPWLLAGWQWSQEDVAAELDAYDDALAYLDRELSLLLEQLHSRGLLNNTLVIVTSDHGEEFHEHKLMGHGSSLYLPSLHVPLVISFPGRVPAGLTVPDTVSLRDLPTTILDLLNIEASQGFPGQSLRRHWDRPLGSASAAVLSELGFAANLPNWYPVSKGDMHSLVSDDLHYIQNGDCREELYDIARDPLEQRDLSTHQPPIIERFRARLTRLTARRVESEEPHASGCPRQSPRRMDPRVANQRRP